MIWCKMTAKIMISRLHVKQTIKLNGTLKLLLVSYTDIFKRFKCMTKAGRKILTDPL